MPKDTNNICEFDERVNLILLIMFIIVVIIITFKGCTCSHYGGNFVQSAIEPHSSMLSNDSSLVISTLDTH